MWQVRQLNVARRWAGGEGFFACFEAAGDTGLAAGVAAGFGEDAGAAFVVAALAVAPFDVAAFGFFNAAPAEVNDWRGDAEEAGFLTSGEGDCFGAEEVADGELLGETAGALAAVPEGAMAGLVVAGTAGSTRFGSGCGGGSANFRLLQCCTSGRERASSSGSGWGRSF